MTTHRSVLSLVLFALVASAPLQAGCDAPAAAEAPVRPPPSAATPASGASLDLVERGRHLVTTSGCHDCHTPWKMGPNGPAPDFSRALSGHPETAVVPPPPRAEGPWIVAAYATNTAWSGPWGVSFTANLTPDRETGLGKWNAEIFKQTIRTGRHMGQGREVLPPMPIPVYRNFTDDELAAIFAYLQSIPAVTNRVPQPLPPTPVGG